MAKHKCVHCSCYDAESEMRRIPAKKGSQRAASWIHTSEEGCTAALRAGESRIRRRTPLYSNSDGNRTAGTRPRGTIDPDVDDPDRIIGWQTRGTTRGNPPG